MSECNETCVSVSSKDKKLKHDRKEDNPKDEAIILYPSFGAPLLTQPGKTLRLYVLFEEKLYKLYELEHQTDPKTPKTIKVINKALKIIPFTNGKKDLNGTLFPSEGAALSNIRCISKGVMAKRSLEDEEEKLFAYVREKPLRKYTSHPKGFRHLFMLEIDNLGLGEGIYDCGWKSYDEECSANSMYPTAPTPERQDLIANEFLEEGREDKRFIKQDTGFKISKTLDFVPDPDLPLCNHHVIYITSKPKLNLGQLTDVHVSSRQCAFKKCEAQVLPGAGDDVSPKVSDMVNVTFETLKDLLDQMGQDDDIDILVITGDLIDFNQNFDPPSANGNWQSDFKKPGKLWDWLSPSKFDKEKNGRNIYPYYIDMVTVYSLLLDFITQHKKPIIMLTGNHEAYDQPYGISPRFGTFWGLNPEGWFPANEGIPADHNLTVYEATLVYGPKYYTFEHVHNFNKKRLEWFYQLFTPLSDVTITYENQSFTALSWNDDEAFISPTIQGGGSLPRATEAVSNEQLDLLRVASICGEDRILLTHFTFVNYSMDYQISAAGKVSYGEEMGHYEEGSFTCNREEVYEMLYKGAFTHTFSGHSHRAGLYVMTGKDEWMETVNVQGHPIELTPMKLNSIIEGNKTRLIVGASGGPVPVQNHYNSKSEVGLSVWSLDYPSGNVLKLRGGSDMLHLKRTQNKAAQPRFAVALSFFNTTKVEVGNNSYTGVFQKFESGNNEDEFQIEIHSALPSERFIDTMSMYNYLDRWERFSMPISNNTTRSFVVSFDKKKAASELIMKKKQNDSKARNFLSIEFNGILKSKLGYKQYDYKSPWNFPVKFQHRYSEKRRFASPKYEIDTDTMPEIIKGYELNMDENVPDFKWYRKTFSDYRAKPAAPEIKDRPGF